jgi:nucleoside-diphosphate kinase
MMEKTLVLIKPDAVERKLIGEIISIYEKKGLNITDMKLVRPSAEVAKEHYVEHKDRPYFENLINYFTRGKVCAMIIEGDNAVAMVRKINGATNPLDADMGTIRGQFGLSKTENIVHSSDSVESAEREIKIWFFRG